MSTVDVAVLLGAAWGGAVLGQHLTTHAGALLWVVLAVHAGVLLFVLWTRGRCPRGLLVLAALAVAVTSAWGAAVRMDVVRHGPLATLAQGTRTVEVDLVAVSDVRTASDGRAWVLGRLRSVVAGPDAHRWRTRERVMLWPAEGHDVQMGARYRVVGTVRRLEGDLAVGMARQGVAVAVDAWTLQQTAPPPAWLRTTTTVRDRVRDAAARHLPPPEASLLTGLVTGDLTGQPADVETQVTDAGLSHLVAVSGSNVGVVVLATVGLVGGLVRHRRAAWWTALLSVWWFVVLVRAEPSVVRAAVMATLVLLAALVGRLRSTPHLLCTAGLLALLVDPMLAVRLGFILSMAATAGVIVGLGPLERALAAHLPLLPAPLRRILAATCGAQVAVAPILLLAGGTVHPASLPANLVAVPAAGLAGAVGGVMALTAVVAPDVAAVVAVVARPALRVVLLSARVFSGPEGRTAAVVGVLLLGLWILLRTGGARVQARTTGTSMGAVTAVGVAVVGAALLVVSPGSGGALPDTPVLVALDVGQGDALLLGDPAAGWMLVDTGADDDVVARRLGDHGVTRLASVVLTHPHDDHVGGLQGVLQAAAVGAVVVGPRGEGVGTGLAGGPPVVHAAAGSTWQHGSLRIEVLSPPPTGLGGEPNENSLVLLVTTGEGRTALLTGDAEVIAQTRLRDDPRIDVDVLKVPHHGGDTNAEGFLAATTPEVAVISVGADNRFGHPHPDVLADLRGVVVRRTDHDGDVVVSLLP